MTKQESNLSEKINGYDPLIQIVVKGDAKHHIKQAHKMLNNELTMIQNSNPDISDEISLEINKKIVEEINKIFKQQFGEDLIK